MQRSILSEDAFLTMLSLERKRTERSNRRFVLMLLACGKLLKAGDRQAVLDKILCGLADSIRETDIRGWYEDGLVIGVIFTEIGTAEGRSVAGALLTKVTAALSTGLSIEQIGEIRLSFRVFPEDWEEGKIGSPADLTLYPDLVERSERKRTARILKRSIDIAGSLAALIVLSPVLLAIAVAIKLTSKGPILFRQKRLGLNGEAFTFLKFRSMYASNDHGVHQEFVKRLISGRVDPECPLGDQQVYKLTKDPRVTSIGRFLRRTSLDELPQFVNTLAGDMSLVGPRPPIPYEVESYDIWHRKRLQAIKPGITGLWQVQGRSRVKFDDMVRLDLQYASSWSLWGDIRILLQTPRAVFTGAGAH